MPPEKVAKELDSRGLLSNYLEFSGSTATARDAADAIGCDQGQIAKTLAFSTHKGPIVILMSGTSRVDNKKFKAVFGEKANFPPAEALPKLVGHPAGGVCPFALNEGVVIYIDKSLEKFDPVYPAAGTPNNAVKMTLAQLAEIAGNRWIDVGKA